LAPPPLTIAKATAYALFMPPAAQVAKQTVYVLIHPANGRRRPMICS
jgi:hypothetical protein